MILAVAYFDTTDPDAFLGALEQTGDLFEDVPGFNGFELRRGIEDPKRFLLTADWDSVDSHTAWQEAHVEEFLSALSPFLDGTPDIKHFA